MVGVLVRHGRMGEVSRFRTELPREALIPGGRVVVPTSRGVELGEIVGVEPGTNELPAVLRLASADDETTATERQRACETEFSLWQQRLATWQIEAQLIDLECTLDGGKWILYVLNDRGPETTKLAIRAAAAGLGLIEVQPVGLEGLLAAPPRQGCSGCRH